MHALIGQVVSAKIHVPVRSFHVPAAPVRSPAARPAFDATSRATVVPGRRSSQRIGHVVDVSCDSRYRSALRVHCEFLCEFTVATSVTTLTMRAPVLLSSLPLR